MLFALVLVVVLVNFCSGAPTKCQFRATVTCHKEPMPYARLEIFGKELRTEEDGSFVYESSDLSKCQPDEVKVFFDHMGKHKFEIGADNPDQLYSIRMLINNPNQKVLDVPFLRKCAAYKTLVNVMKDFEIRGGGRALPYPKLILKLDRIIIPPLPGYDYSAWASPDAFRVPHMFVVSGFHDTFMHEFGHTLQISYNGNFADYIADVTKYRNDPKNLGMGFMEGWAAYWAKKCLKIPAGTKPNYGLNGHNAASFCDLHKKCHSDSIEGDQKFLDVLKNNRRKINNFDEFEKAHKAMYGCDLKSGPPTTTIPPTTTTKPPPPNSFAALLEWLRKLFFPNGQYSL